ncbi:helix-turn-helix domain-containing protein [Streptomyces sp. RPT161]|uniref:helix-turn-helix domain-containing protein n=1 Tax=Streptomyces sp. RPT161 TaxID=3015993 RepID=UPI0022B8ED92|nr:helix-turn-helix domain-containing protein [Streptomyces sp. RPT161]
MMELAGQTLADKLNYLFAATKSPAGREYSNEHVAAAIRNTGVMISQSYIWQLRKSKKTNPTLSHLQALADFFSVPVAYFFDDQTADRVTKKLALLEAEISRFDRIMGDGQVQLIAMRAAQLSQARRQQVMDLLEVVYRLELAERRGLASEAGRPEMQNGEEMRNGPI